MDIVSNYPLNDYPYTHRLAWLSANTRGFLVQWMVVNTETHSYSKCKVSVVQSATNSTSVSTTKPQGPVQKRGQEGCKGREVMEDQSGTVPSEHDRPLHSGTHSGGTRPALDQANHHSTKEEGGACGPTPNRRAVGSPVHGFFRQRTSFL